MYNLPLIHCSYCMLWSTILKSSLTGDGDILIAIEAHLYAICLMSWCILVQNVCFQLHLARAVWYLFSYIGILWLAYLWMPVVEWFIWILLWLIVFNAIFRAPNSQSFLASWNCFFSTRRSFLTFWTWPKKKLIN